MPPQEEPAESAPWASAAGWSAGVVGLAVADSAGVPVRVTNYLGVPHGFASFPGATLVGAQHRAEIVDELRLRLGVTGR